MQSITVSPDSRFYWLFSWLTKAVQSSWGIDPEDMNVCKLFWGALFLPLGYPCRYIGGGTLGCLGLVVFAFLMSLLDAGSALANIIMDVIYLGLGATALVVAILFFVLHRLERRRSKMSPKERWEDPLDPLIDWGERSRSRVEAFAEAHEFITASVVLPFLICHRLAKLAWILLAPIAVPAVTPVVGAYKRWEKNADAKYEQSRHYPQGPGPVGQAFESFHNRTCRKIVVE